MMSLFVGLLLLFGSYEQRQQHQLKAPLDAGPEVTKVANNNVQGQTGSPGQVWTLLFFNLLRATSQVLMAIMSRLVVTARLGLLWRILRQPYCAIGVSFNIILNVVPAEEHRETKAAANDRRCRRCPLQVHGRREQQASIGDNYHISL